MIPSKPAPQPTEASQPFWDACRRHELRIQRCAECDMLIHYPKLCCPRDGTTAFEWPLMDGRGSVHSYAVCRRAFHPAFKEETPYVVAIIELDEGVRMISNVIGTHPEAVEIGMRVTLEWDDAGEIPLPKFRPLTGDVA